MSFIKFVIVFFRILAFGLDFVNDDDIIVTADVDAFIMTPTFLQPLQVVGKRILLLFQMVDFSCTICRRGSLCGSGAMS